ncbi:MAG: hypothetical protein SW833_06860 [Cyanobacteriota bacterium]|nr:hypothetical protein [Cyanobacteriota bacterium]
MVSSFIGVDWGEAGGAGGAREAGGAGGAGGYRYFTRYIGDRELSSVWQLIPIPIHL